MTQMLKECPFCGGNAELHRAGNSGDRVYWRAICGSCLTREDQPGKEAAIEAWNTRASSIPEPEAASRDAIKHMVDHFLQWRLPENFHPDAGISFKPSFGDEPMRSRHWPVGTNLFNADQAEAMVRFMVEGLSAVRPEAASSDEDAIELGAKAYIEATADIIVDRLGALPEGFMRWDDADEDGRELSRIAMRAAIAAMPRLSAEPEAAPIPMLLYCPKCGSQHIDQPDERTPDWTNPPHRSHLCHDCGCIWRPADVPTNGVAAIETHGKADTWLPSKQAMPATRPEAASCPKCGGARVVQENTGPSVPCSLCEAASSDEDAVAVVAQAIQEASRPFALAGNDCVPAWSEGQHQIWAAIARAAIAAMSPKHRETESALRPSFRMTRLSPPCPEAASSDEDAVAQALDELGRLISEHPVPLEARPGTGGMSSPSMRPSAPNQERHDALVKAFQLVDCRFGALQDRLSAEPEAVTLIDAEQIRELIRQACNGNYSAWAERNGVSASFVCDVLHGRREPSGAVLNPLKLERVVSYRALTNVSSRAPR